MNDTNDINDMNHMNNKRNIETICIGLTGRMGCGKGEVVHILKELGYTYTSLSDIVREEAAKLGREVTREETQNIGNGLRREGGAGVLGKRIREKIESAAPESLKWVIDGVRNPAEVLELKKLNAFYLLGIDADLDLIIERIKLRRRGTDSLDDNEIKKRMDREWGIGEPEDGQQVGKCMNMADFIIRNNNGLDQLKIEIVTVLDRIGTK
ncbi:MAG: AAA family ATPase [Candidatus Omnitrophota bacterium]